MNTATHIHLKRNPSRPVRSPKVKEIETTSTPKSNKAKVHDFYDLVRRIRRRIHAGLPGATGGLAT